MTDSERQVQADLYCILRNAIEHSYQTEPMRREGREGRVLGDIDNVEVEVPIDASERADVVVFKKEEPFLVIEVKKRAFTQPGRSLAAASKQVYKYARKLQSPFSAVCDGWIFILYKTYRNFRPLTIVGYNSTDTYAINLLSELLANEGSSAYAFVNSKLPQVPDPDFVMRRIIPVIERELTIKFPNQ